MDLEKLKELREKTHLLLADSEMAEINGKETYNLFNELRKLGFYRIYNTYYKDEYQCHQLYAVGFLNSETGYEWLIDMADDDIENKNITEIKFNVYIVLQDDSKYDRKDKKLFTGTIKEILDYTKHIEKVGYEQGKKHKSIYLK